LADRTGSVIFDYDGTLVDTASAFVDSVNEALREAKLRLATRREVSGTDLRSMIKGRLGEAKSQVSIEDVFNSIWNEFADALSSPFPLRDGAAETLEELKKQGMSLALISKRGGRAGRLPLVELRVAGLDKAFRFVKAGVGLSEYGGAISTALVELGGTARESVIVSDWCADIEYAKSLGLTTVGITGGVSDEDEHQKAGADWIVDHLIQIPTLWTVH